MSEKPTTHVVRDVVIGILVTVVGTVLVAYANLPTRVALVEQQQTTTEKTIEKMDVKLDKILLRLPRPRRNDDIQE